MLSVEERILLLDEVASTARSSWQIHLIGHERFSDFPEEHRQHPAYLGYRNMTNLLSVSLMTACYALIDTHPKTYSFHHAVSDKDLQISSTFKEHCDVCFSLKKKISKYRSNVVAHVNAKRTQSDWADAAGIKNEEIDEFLHSARAAIEELVRDNLGGFLAPVVTMPVRDFFFEYCSEITGIKSARRGIP
jgi:hypothetical protein